MEVSTGREGQKNMSFDYGCRGMAGTLYRSGFRLILVAPKPYGFWAINSRTFTGSISRHSHSMGETYR